VSCCVESESSFTFQSFKLTSFASVYCVSFSNLSRMNCSNKRAPVTRLSSL
jgi:hypothetical protein